MDMAIVPMFFESLARVSASFCGLFSIIIIFLFERTRQNEKDEDAMIYIRTNAGMISALFILAIVAIASSLLLGIPTGWLSSNGYTIAGFVLIILTVASFLLLGYSTLSFLDEVGSRELKGD